MSETKASTSTAKRIVSNRGQAGGTRIKPKAPEPPDAVLWAMEDEDGPLPDAVAAAWAS